MSASWRHALRWLRTVQHFPVSALWHRFRLRLMRGMYRPEALPEGQIRLLMAQDVSVVRVLLSFGRWQFQHDAAFRQRVQHQCKQLLASAQGELLNEPFTLFSTESALSEALSLHTPLWRENYGYLEFLQPLLYALGGDSNAALLSTEERQQAICLLETQCQLFWSLPFEERTWSTYGVSRRLLVYMDIVPILPACSAAFVDVFWQALYQEAHYLVRFLEWDVGGNHLARNLKAWLAVVCVLETQESMVSLAEQWWKTLSRILNKVFEQQLLADGVHFERTPMYHLWVLQDVLECLTWLKACQPDYDRTRLETVASRMLAVAMALRHSSGQIPLLGDSSLLQTPDPDRLFQYAQAALSLTSEKISEKILPETLPNETIPSSVIPAALRSKESPLRETLTHFPHGGFAVFRLQNPHASLILDCGDFGPRRLPAHSHCDLGSVEVHVQDRPILVDSGISEYVPSLLRDYFRGTPAHNTVWVPGEEQAEIWSSFRVAGYPDFKGCQVEQDSQGAKVTVGYDNHNIRYEHQRSVYSVDDRFWVVQDWLPHLYPVDRACYSLLHVHPDCEVRYENEIFTVDERLLVIPFGARQVQWSDHSPWRQNLNLYSAGFSAAQRGKLLALTPNRPDCFGWVLVPCVPEHRPHCVKRGESVELRFQGGMDSTALVSASERQFEDTAYQLTWDSLGLRVAFRGPSAEDSPG